MKKIDPRKVTNFTRTLEELEYFWLFCIIVAGRNADMAADKLSKFLSKKPEGIRPFAYLCEHSVGLHNMLVANKVGQYHRIEFAIRESLGYDMRTVTLEQLEGIFGVGPKTARFFLMHTRPDQRMAVIDTHMLKWLREHNVENVPDGPPATAAEYKRLEEAFIVLARSYYRGVSLADVDLLIWNTMSGRLENDQKEPAIPGEKIVYALATCPDCDRKSAGVADGQPCTHCGYTANKNHG